MQKKKIGGFKSKRVSETYQGINISSSGAVPTIKAISGSQTSEKQTRELEEKLSTIWQTHENEYNRLLLAKDKNGLAVFKNKMTEIFMRNGIDIKYIKTVFPGK